MESNFTPENVGTEASEWLRTHTVMNNDFLNEALCGKVAINSKMFWLYHRHRELERYGKTGYCFKGREAFAEELKTTPNAISGAYRKLIEHGLMVHVWAKVPNANKKQSVYLSTALVKEHGLILRAENVYDGKARKMPEGKVAIDLETWQEVTPKNANLTPKSVRVTPKNANLTPRNDLNYSNSNSIELIKKNDCELAKKPNDIKALIDCWNTTMGGNLNVNKLNIYAMARLLKKYKREQLESVIKALPEMMATPYEARVADFVDIEAKWNKIMDWGRRRLIAKQQAEKSKIEEQEYKPFD